MGMEQTDGHTDGRIASAALLNAPYYSLGP